MNVKIKQKLAELKIQIEIQGSQGGLSMLYYLLYLSRSKHFFHSGDLINLLLKSRKKNEQQQITGLLLHSKPYFIQFIEGQKKNVDSLFHTIQNDPRHHEILILDQGPEEQRLFPQWHMGFNEHSFWNNSQLPGLIQDLTQINKLQVANEHIAPMRILQSFARQMQLEQIEGTS